MNDEITINLRSLGEKEREILLNMLAIQTTIVPDETNEEALETLQNFTE